MSIWPATRNTLAWAAACECGQWGHAKAGHFRSLASAIPNHLSTFFFYHLTHLIVSTLLLSPICLQSIWITISVCMWPAYIYSQLWCPPQSTASLRPPLSHQLDYYPSLPFLSMPIPQVVLPPPRLQLALISMKPTPSHTYKSIHSSYIREPLWFSFIIIFLLENHHMVVKSMEDFLLVAILECTCPFSFWSYTFSF